MLLGAKRIGRVGLQHARLAQTSHTQAVTRLHELQ